MRLSTKAKTIISLSLFFAILLALVLVASFCDYQVSEILTSNSLKDGEYYADDFFGVFLEIVGSNAIYLMAGFVCCILFWACLKLWDKKPFNIIFAVVLAIGSVVAVWFTLKDAVSYMFDQVFKVVDPEEFEVLDKLYHSGAFVAVELTFAAIIASLALISCKHFKEETLKKLVKFALASVVALAVANLLIMVVKGPVGRMRFRAINSTLGKSLIDSGVVQGYTPWYIANGQPSKEVLDMFERAYMVTDAFKSFPSGHTCAAGASYCLLIIPDVIDFKNKKGAKAVFWSIPIIATMLVAISRIVCGAHYMSDVTFGGTIAFVCVILAREIFILKGEHFFALFPMLKKKPALDCACESDADSVAQEQYSDDSALNVECEQDGDVVDCVSQQCDVIREEDVIGSGDVAEVVSEDNEEKD